MFPQRHDAVSPVTAPPATRSQTLTSPLSTSPPSAQSVSVPTQTSASGVSPPQGTSVHRSASAATPTAMTRSASDGHQSDKAKHLLLQPEKRHSHSDLDTPLSPTVIRTRTTTKLLLELSEVSSLFSVLLSSALRPCVLTVLLFHIFSHCRKQMRYLLPLVQCNTDGTPLSCDRSSARPRRRRPKPSVRRKQKQTPQIKLKQKSRESKAYECLLFAIANEFVLP